MPIEITILSGARQGERLVLDSGEFRAGGEAGCEVYFDPRLDPGALGRTVTLRRTEEGWQIRRTGIAGVLVNHQPLEKSLPVRSGNIVRLSPAGPDFAVRFVASTSLTLGPSPTGPSGATLASMGASSAPRPLDHRAIIDNVSLAAETFVPILTVVDESALLPREPRPSPAADQTRFVVIAAGGVIVCVLLFVLALVFILKPTADPPAVAENPSVRSEREEDAAPPAPVAAAPAPSPEPSPAPAPIAASPAESHDPLDRVRGAVCLTLVEHQERLMPFASGCAVSGDMVLTTGREAMQLAAWQAKGDWKIWVKPSGSEELLAVDSIRVPISFASAAEGPEWVFFNLGLVKVRGTLRAHVAVAAVEELQQLKHGAPLRCVGYGHDGGILTREERVSPDAFKTRVFGLIKPPNRPLLLEIASELPANLYGSPLVNGDGHIVAVYCDALQPPPDQKDNPAIKNHHYAVAVPRDLVVKGLTADEGYWTLPPTTPTAKPKNE